MIRPVLIPAPRDLGIPKLVQDIGKVVGETATKEALNIFKHKRFGPCFPNSPHRFGKEVPAVRLPTVFPAQRKWLAWWAPKHEIHFPMVGAEVKVSHVGLNDVPAASVTHPSSLIELKRLDGVLVPVRHEAMAETGVGRPNRQASSASE